jgi:MFS family permease
MSTCIASRAEDIRPALSRTSSIALAFVTAMTFLASGAAPTALYHLYQESFGLTPLAVTIIFAAYVLSLLLALLTVGSLSDYIGRRPAILTALVMNMAAMALFITAGSAFALIVARSVQGFATGLATATLGATILDLDRSRGPVLNSITAFAGLSAGSLGAAALVTYAPDPAQLVYFVLLAVSAIEAALLLRMPETAPAKPGAFQSLLPHVNVPVAARNALVQLTPVTIASWALGGFYFSLMPSLVRIATGATQPIVGGLVVSTLTLSGVTSVLALRNIPPEKTVVAGIMALTSGVAITLAGAHTQLVVGMLAGTIVSGVGFGAAFSGAMRTILPLAKAEERAGLLSAFYVEGYLSYSLPAILAGSFAPMVGLTTAADGYGGAVILMALISLIATVVTRSRVRMPTPIK